MPTRAALEEGSHEPCGDEINICDDVTYADDGFEEVYSGEEVGDGFAQVVIQNAAAYYGQAPFCPGGFGGVWTHNINVPTPEGTKVYKSFNFQGLHALQFENPPASGRYSLPPGYWPSTDGSGVTAQAQAADSRCIWTFPAPGRLNIDIAFFRYHHVNARWPRRRGISNGGGGGGDGGSGCTSEYVYLEVDYGDGTGWHVIWEGWADVCG